MTVFHKWCIYLDIFESSDDRISDVIFFEGDTLKLIATYLKP